MSSKPPSPNPARGRSVVWILAGLALLAVAALGVSRDARGEGLEERVARLEAAQQTEQALRGKRVFTRACAACHGGGGKGDGPAAGDLDPPPRDLTSRRYRFRSTTTGSLPTPDDLARTIRHGLPGSQMPTSRLVGR